LFSTWDELVGHQRRYSRRRLLGTAKRAGLAVSSVTAWNLVSFLPAVVLRTKDRVFGSSQTTAQFPEVHPIVNAGLKLTGHVERFLSRMLSLRLGLSFAAVLAKR
jgi:hypothetical protein